MNNTIDFMHLSAKVPGYLFILANLTNPGDAIQLNCPGEKRDFISSMLGQIGLNVQSCMYYPEEIAPESYVLSVCEDLQYIKQNKANATTEVLLLPYQLPIQQFKHCAKDILPRHPNQIIIDELQDLTERKTFSVALSKESHFYARLKRKIGSNLI